MMICLCVTIVPVNSCKFLKPNIVAYSDANFETVQIQECKLISRRQCFRLLEANTSFDIDIKQMHLTDI